MTALPARLHQQGYAKAYAMLRLAALADRQLKESEGKDRRAAKLEIICRQFGLDPSESGTLDRARELYASSKKARNNIGKSLMGVIRALDTSIKTAHKYESDLPIILDRPSDCLKVARKEILLTLSQVHHESIPGNMPSANDWLHDIDTALNISLDPVGQTIIWWFFVMPEYRGKRQDMAALAGAWNLTTASARKFTQKLRTLTNLLEAGNSAKILDEAPPEWALIEPYGFYTGEQDVLITIDAMIAAGSTLSQVAAKLNKLGKRTRSGTCWRAETLRRFTDKG